MSAGGPFRAATAGRIRWDMSRRVVTSWSLFFLTLATACAPGGGPPAGGWPDDAVDGGVPDGEVVEIDAAVGPGPDAATDSGIVARTWPRTAADLRGALGGRGGWTSAWQLDEAGGAAADDLGPSGLAAAGSLAYRQPGAWADDRAFAFDSVDDALIAAIDPFELTRTRSLAALFSIRFDTTTGGTAIAGKRGPAAGAVLLAVDPVTGHLSAELHDGTRAALATLPIDHRDGRHHDVLVVIDRQAHVLRLMSDLGRSPKTVIATLGDAASVEPFVLGSARGQDAAAVSLAFAAIATDDVAGLADDGDDALHALRVATERTAPIVRPPAGMPWAPPWPIRRDRRGRYTIDVHPHDLPVITGAHVWISPAGDDAGVGTASVPKRSLRAALTGMTTSTTIHVAPGVYDADAGWYGVNPRFDVNIIAEGGRARFTAADADLVWQQSPAGFNVYQAAIAAPPYAVIDDTAAGGGDPWLAARSSLAEVATTPGTWFAAGGVVTVHTRNGRVPDGHVQVMPAATLNGYINDPERTVYLEGIDLEGGYKALHVQRARRLIIVDSTFRYAATEGLSVLATGEVLAFRAVAEANARDGLAYTATPRVLEVDCAGRGNGRGGSNIDNGSTVHDGGTVIRLGGDYRDNGGPNVADVQGAWSWNLGTTAGGSRATSSTQRVNFYIDGQMWLREATARDRPEDTTIDLVSAPGSHLHAHDSDRASVGGLGTIDERAE